MKIRIFFINLVFLICCFNLNIYAINSDSLYSILQKQMKNDNIAALNTMHELFLVFEKSNIDSSFFYAKLLLKEASQLNNHNYIQKAYLALSKYYSIKDEHDQELNYLGLLKNSLKDHPDKKNQALLLHQFGNTFFKIADYSNSINYYLQSLIISEELNDKSGMAKTLNNIGSIYLNTNNLDEALSYYLKSLQLKKQLNDKAGSSLTLLNIGIIYVQQKKYKEALEFYLKSTQINQELTNWAGLCENYNELGNLYNLLGNSKISIGYFKKTSEIAQKYGFKISYIKSILGISEIYILNKDFAQSLIYGKKALSLIDTNNNIKQLKYCYQNLIKSYTELGDLRKALEYSNKLINLTNRLHLNELNTKLHDLEIKNDFLKQIQYEPSKSKQKRKTNEFVIKSFLQNFLISLLILFVIIVFFRTKLKNLESFIVSKYDQSLEDRFFGFLPSLMIFQLLILIIFNLYLKFYLLSGIIFLFIPLFIVLQFLAKKDRYSYLIKESFNIFSLVLLDLTYFYNGGLQGPVLIFLYLQSFIATIISKKTHYIWLMITILNASFLIIFEYLFPNLIQFNYKDEFSKYLDLSILPVFIMPIFFALIQFIKFNYESEKSIVNKHKLDLEEKSEILESANLEIIRQKNDLKKQTENLIESNNLKDKLFSIISHDLRNPLTAQLNYSELLESRYYQLDDNARLEIIKGINNAVKANFQLLENLLFWSRANSGSLSFIPLKANLHNLISNIYQNNLIQSKIKNIKIKFHVPVDLSIYADIDMINVILRNLITNAVKFSYEGNEIIIEAKKYTFKRILVSIQDFGIGIEPEMLGNLFNFSRQTQTLGTNSEKGSGLGLIICKEFLERHNCEIWVESEFKKGSTFYFTLPEDISL